MRANSRLKKAKNRVASRAALWDISSIKGAAPLRALLVSVIRRLFFCPEHVALQPGGPA